MIQEFVKANALYMFAFGLLLACAVGLAEGFRKARNDNGAFSYKRALSQVASIIAFYSIFGGGGLYLATRLQN